MWFVSVHFTERGGVILLLQCSLQVYLRAIKYRCGDPMLRASKRLNRIKIVKSVFICWDYPVEQNI